MDAEELRETHARLHAELAKAGQVDPESRRILAQIMQDISRLIDAPPTATPPPTAGADPDPDAAAGAGASADAGAGVGPGAVERLETVAVQFEAGHPALAANIRRFVDLLSKAGV
jgi:hypothetical protein